MSEPILGALNLANMEVDEIDEVVIVGGTTRIPKV